MRRKNPPQKLAAVSAVTPRSAVAGVVVAASLALVPALALAVETDKLTVEDQTSGAVMFRVTSAGNVTGNSFTGDGSGLTNVTHWKGTWSATTAYNPSDCVLYNGSSYIAILQNTGVTPGSDNTKWAVMAAQGPTGAAGAQGLQGPQGIQGPVGSPDTQIQILGKIATQADGAVLSLQQGPTEVPTSGKLTIKDSAGTINYQVSSNGSVTSNGTNIFGRGMNPQPLSTVSTIETSANNFNEIYVTSHSAAGNPSLVLYKSRGTMSSPQIVSNNDFVGSFFARGYDGSAYKNASGVRFAVEGTPVLGSVPGNITFHTTTVGASNFSEKMRVTSSGNVGIGTTTPTQKIEVNGGVRINTVAAKPNCDSTVRGTFWVTQSGTGITDKLEVCIKDATDAYVWKAVW